MASKATIVNGEERPAPKRQRPDTAAKWADGVVGRWQEFTRFLSDVRAEMRKVVTPSRKEVQATTIVVIVAVFIFGMYFFVVDGIFSYGMEQLLKKLGGIQ